MPVGAGAGVAVPLARLPFVADGKVLGSHPLER